MKVEIYYIALKTTVIKGGQNMKNVSQYDQEMLQSHTIYLPTAPEKRAEEQQQKD